MFNEDPPWLGADCATSIRLDNDRYLWIFQDTIVGNVSQGKRERECMTRNSVAIWDHTRKLQHALRGNCAGGGGTGFLSPLDPSRWYWTETGLVVDGLLYLFSKVMTNPCGVGCTQVGITLSVLNASADDPLVWPLLSANLLPGFASGLSWPTALVRDGSWVYMLGRRTTEQQLRFPAAATFDEAVAARLPLATLASPTFDEALWNETLEFYTHDGWRPLVPASSLAPLFDDAPPETSLFRLGDRWAVLSIPFDAPDLQIRVSAPFEGPPLPGTTWSEPETIFRIPPELCCDRAYSYAPKLHPELARRPDDQLVVTFVSNSQNSTTIDGDLRLYVPRVLRLKLTLRDSSGL